MTAPHIQALVDAAYNLHTEWFRLAEHNMVPIRCNAVLINLEKALAAFEAAERAQPAPAPTGQLEAAKDVIAFVGPGLLVLRNMLHHAELSLGEAKAKEMIKAVQDFLATDSPLP